VKVDFKKGILLLSLFLFTVSCEMNQSADFKARDKFHVLVDTVFIDVPAFTSPNLISLFTAKIENTEHLIGYNYQNHSIDIYNLKNRVYKTTIPLKRDGPDFVSGVRALDLYSDEQFIIADDYHLTLLDFNGQVLERFSINIENSELKGFDFLEGRVMVNRNSGLQYDPSNQSLILEAYFFRPFDPLIHSPYLTEVNLKEKAISLIDLPDLSSRFVYENNYGELRGINFLRIGDSLILNPKFSSDVHLVTNGESSSYQLRSSYTDNLAEPLKLMNGSLSESRVQHQLKSVQFYPMVWDPFQELFYRAHKSQLDDLNQESEFFLTIADKDFRKVLEFKLPEGYYIFPIIASDGVLFSAFNKHDDKLELIRYRFSR